MFQWILSFLTGPIIKGALDAYKAKLDAGNTSERIAADIAIRELEVEKREREVNASLVVAEQGNWFTRIVRPLWAMPFIVYTWKLVVWDKVLGSWTNGTTDPLSGGMETLIITISVAYFGGRSAETIARILKR